MSGAWSLVEKPSHNVVVFLSCLLWPGLVISIKHSIVRAFESVTTQDSSHRHATGPVQLHRFMVTVNKATSPYSWLCVQYTKAMVILILDVD